MDAIEVNFDGLIGPTHHFGGHAYGNIASMQHGKSLSYPRQAALEGLKKMKLLADLGIPQGIFPPQMRPSVTLLRTLGFSGTDGAIIEKVAKEDPSLLYALSSSSAMWTANSATVAPSTDTQDGRLHLTVANLASQFHRKMEAEETYRLFRTLFHNQELFALHPPLPSGGDFNDEGGANHTRFCTAYGQEGVHLFVYGKSAFEKPTSHFPFRQAKECSEAVARINKLNRGRTFFARQNPAVIEAGVFHNDVIAVGNLNFFLYHEKAFLDSEQIIGQIQEIFPLHPFCVTEEMLSVKEAVKSYFFNGQLLTLPQGSPLLLLPEECASLDLSWLPCNTAFISVGESMHNGGGPACLRLRCVLNAREKEALSPSLFLTPPLYETLKKWIEKYYRETLALKDLADPLLLLEVKEALHELTQILNLKSFYESSSCNFTVKL